MTSKTIHRNLDLVRELMTSLLMGNHSLHIENAMIIECLGGSDEYELMQLPGESIEGIINNLKQVLALASEPVSIPTTGRGKLCRRLHATIQRDELHLFARVSLALLATDTNQVQP